MPPSFTSKSGFRAIYREHYGFVWATVRRLGVLPALVDDAAQDTFVVAYRRRDEFAATTARPWLYGIARGVASNYRRSARRNARKRRAVADASTVRGASGRELHAQLHDLDRFLRDLSARDRELFMLSEVEGFTGPEIADALGCNTSTAYGRVRSLRQRFARHADPESLGRARDGRPRASAHGWVALVEAVRTPKIGWLGLGASGSTVTAGGIGATVAAVAVAGWVSVREAADVPRDDADRVRSAVVDPPARDKAPVEDSQDGDPPVVAELLPRRAPPAVLTPTSVSPRPTRRATVDRPEDEPTASPTDDLARQNALLREASTALAADDPERALAAMRRHAVQFPDSTLSDLRTALRVEALCAVGKGAQARGEARAHASAHPGSPMRERILDACPADPPRSGQDGS